MLLRASRLKDLKHKRVKNRTSTPKPPVHRNYTTHSEKFVFGIDYGSHLAKVAVFERKTGRPIVLRNTQDGNVPYWHTTVAYDKTKSKLVSGKTAKAIARVEPGLAVTQVKKILGTAPGHKLFDGWITSNSTHKAYVEPQPEIISEESKESPASPESKELERLPSAGQNKVVVVLDALKTSKFSSVELAATTFESMKNVMMEWSQIHGGDGTSLPEAYLSVPADFDEHQRQSIIQAAKLAGINVLKLIEEPVAALYNVRRIENFGWYSVTDFGDTLKSYVVRVFDGEYDIYDQSYIEIPEILPLAEQTFFNHLKAKLPWARRKLDPHDKELIKIFDLSREVLIDQHECQIPRTSWISKKIPYISREARTLSTFYELRNAGIEEKIHKSVSRSVDPAQITHPVLIGGNSLAYNEISHLLERVFGTRLSDTVTSPEHSIAVGTALKAAEDLGLAPTILRGKDCTYLGYPSLSRSYVDTLHHHLSLSRNHMPLASTFNFSTLAMLSPIEPLLPAFHEEQLLPENAAKPYPAISYTLQRDPFSGELEHWARLSIRAPKPPPQPITDLERDKPKSMPVHRRYIISDPPPQWLMEEMMVDGEPGLEDVVPDLKLCFVLNLTTSPLYDTSRNVSTQEDPSWESLIANNPDKAKQYTTFGGNRHLSPELAKAANFNTAELLQTIQKHKDSQSGYYRIQNRAHDMIQFIMSNMKDNDYHALISAGGMARAPMKVEDPTVPVFRNGSATRLSTFEKFSESNKQQFLDKVVHADTTGRASSKYLDAITMAHEMFVEHMDQVKANNDLELTEEIEMMRSITQKKFPKYLNTDDRADLPIIPEPSKEPEKWYYPGFTPEIFAEWWALYNAIEYELSEAGKAERKEWSEEEKTEAEAQEKAVRSELDKMFAPFTENPILENDLEGKLLSDVYPQIQFLRGIMSRLDARKKLKKYYGTQHRIVIVTDAQPEQSQLKDIESALQRAARDGVSVTFLSIDGPQFDGPFMQMVSRVKGAKTMRLFREYLWTTSFRQKWGEKTNSFHKEFNEADIRNITVKVDFPHYTIEKVYGGYMTNEEKARLEMQRSPSTLRFKIGSLNPSYDIIPGPTPLEPEGTAMLVKLKPKPGALDSRATDPDWMYDPNKTTDSKAVVVGERLMPSVYSPVTWDISWNDRLGKKCNSTHTLRLTDFNSPVGYCDEPGITRLVRNAKFVELMRKVFHSPYQTELANRVSDFPVFDVDNERSGIKHIPQALENQLIKIYDESQTDILNVANERLLRDVGPIDPAHHNLIRCAAHLMNIDVIKFYQLNPAPPLGYLESATWLSNSIEALKHRDLITVLFERYMKASDIKPLSMFATWKSTLDTFLAATRLKLLQNPSESTPIKVVTLRTLGGANGDYKEPENYPERQLERAPKFFGMHLSSIELDPSKDRRNSIIMANRMNSLGIFPRSDMTPVDPTSLWAANFAAYNHDDWQLIYTHVEQHEDPAFAIPFGFPDPKTFVREHLGPYSKEAETFIESQERLQQLFERNKSIPGYEGLSKDLGLTLMSRIHDDQLFIDLLYMMKKETEQQDFEIEKNAIVGPQQRSVQAIKEYYFREVAPLSSPEEIKKAKKLFAKAIKKTRWAEDAINTKNKMFEDWHKMYNEQRAHPSSIREYIYHLAEKSRQEDIDEATRNHMLDEINSMEQRLLDSNNVLLKYLVDNKDIYNQLVERVGENPSDADLISEIEKVLPPGFLQKELAHVTRVTFPDRGIHPSQVEAARTLSSEELAWQESLQLDNQNPTIPAIESELQTLYKRLEPLLESRYKNFGEVEGSTLPVEVYYGNVPIDWDDRLDRLKRQAKAVIRNRVHREIEEKSEKKHMLRAELTKIAQSRVDHRIFLLNIQKQNDEIDLMNSELPFTDPEEYYEQLEALKGSINKDDYALLVWQEYRRTAVEHFRQWMDEDRHGWRSLIPYAPKHSMKLLEVLNKHNLISQKSYLQYKDPIGYWYGDQIPGHDFFDIEIRSKERPYTFKQSYRRTMYDRQIYSNIGESSNGESSQAPQEEYGMTVSTGDVEDVPENVVVEEASEIVNEEPLVNAEGQPIAAETATEEPLEGEQIVLGGDDEVLETPSKPEEPAERIFTSWEKINDPYDSLDFQSDLDYHIYKMQTVNEPAAYTTDQLMEKRAEVQLHILDMFDENGNIDYAHIRNIKMQYPTLPTQSTVSTYVNTTYDNLDNTGREISTDDLDERELTKQEVELTSSIDLESPTATSDLQEMLDSHRFKIADTQRKKEMLKEWENRYSGFDPISKLYQPYHPASFNPLHNSDLDTLLETYERLTDPNIDLAIEAEFHKEHKKIMNEVIQQQHADFIEYTLSMNDPHAKTGAETYIRESQKLRELMYEPMFDSNNIVNPDVYQLSLDRDQLAFEGRFFDIDWIYFRGLGFHIPVSFAVNQTKPIEWHSDFRNSLFESPPTPFDKYTLKTSPFTTKTMPAYIEHKIENPILEKEKEVLVNLRRYPADRFKATVRRAMEKCYGLAGIKRKGKSPQELAQIARLGELTDNFSLKPVRRIVEPAKPHYEVKELNEEEQKAEAARLLRLKLQGALDNPTSTTSKQETSEDKPKTSTVPGSLNEPVPQTLREKWELAKRITLEQMIRKARLDNKETENFERWTIQQRALRLHKSLDAPTLPIIEYPVYTKSIKESDSLFGLPGVDVVQTVQNLKKFYPPQDTRALRDTMRKEIQQAYRNLAADTKEVEQFISELTTSYESTVRRRFARLTIPVIPVEVEDYMKPWPELEEYSDLDIKHPIDPKLLETVIKESSLPGVDPTFWRSNVPSVVRQRRWLNKKLAKMTTEQVAKWDDYMDQIHDRKIQLSFQISARQDEIAEKMLRQESRFIYGPILSQEMEEVCFEPYPVVPITLDTLDDRHANPNNIQPEPIMADVETQREMIGTAYPDSYTRLKHYVEHALDAEAKRLGYEPKKESDDYDDHGHGHGHH